jgi:hypothetical protein
MILPNVRASFGRSEKEWLLRLLSEGDSGREWQRSAGLVETGIDSLLDHRRTLQAILNHRALAPMPPGLALYVMVRHVLLDHAIHSPVLADYVTALVLEFGQGRRSFRIADYDDKEYFYLVEILEDLDGATGRRAFLLRAHLGNFALWLSGLFPDYVVHRVHRRGAPGLGYYEEMGQTGYMMAADDPHARHEHVLGPLPAALPVVTGGSADASGGERLPATTRRIAELSTCPVRDRRTPVDRRSCSDRDRRSVSPGCSRRWIAALARCLREARTATTLNQPDAGGIVLSVW